MAVGLKGSEGGRVSSRTRLAGPLLSSSHKNIHLPLSHQHALGDKCDRLPDVMLYLKSRRNPKHP